MNCFQIKCLNERRLFDVFEGSLLHIVMKCANAKSCPMKAECTRLTEVLFGLAAHKPADSLHPVRCPHCNKRLLDATTDSRGIIAIKCDTCGTFSRIPILSEHFHSPITFYGAPAHA